MYLLLQQGTIISLLHTMPKDYKRKFMEFMEAMMGDDDSDDDRSGGPFTTVNYQRNSAKSARHDNDHNTSGASVYILIYYISFINRRFN